MEADSHFQRLTHVLLQWQELHGRMADRSPKAFPSWTPALQVVQSADSLDGYAREHLANALARSTQEMSPLGDPLAIKMGNHRWLSAAREESYSDWLAWILQGMKTADAILPLFGYHDERQIHAMGDVETIEREQVIEDGRTDIEGWFGDVGLLLIEVKTRSTGSGLVSQLKRYRRWAEGQRVPETLLVLLGLEEPTDDIAPFVFVGWRPLCSRLRNYARRSKESGLLESAAILLFCGAVEQNILGISARPDRLHAMASLDYIQSWRNEK
jgi:hypothetical protein